MQALAVEISKCPLLVQLQSPTRNIPRGKVAALRSFFPLAPTRDDSLGAESFLRAVSVLTSLAAKLLA